MTLTSNPLRKMFGLGRGGTYHTTNWKFIYQMIIFFQRSKGLDMSLGVCAVFGNVKFGWQYFSRKTLYFARYF